MPWQEKCVKRSDLYPGGFYAPSDLEVSNPSLAPLPGSVTHWLGQIHEHLRLPCSPGSTMVVPRNQPNLLPQEPVYFPLSASLYNLLYVLEQLHSTPQHLQLLFATPGGAVSLLSLVLAQFQSLAPALVSGTQLLADNHLAAHPSKVPAYVPGHGQRTGFTLAEARSTTEPCNSVHPANSPKPGTKWAPKRLGNLRGDKSFSSFGTDKPVRYQQIPILQKPVRVGKGQPVALEPAGTAQKTMTGTH
ncbi:hypothetical protein llap_3650 [Limosa lapponica baueri]|uniref:Uncharacterized protein n=1 Tax=Limosa lapponica baueri TaxID=1758121 RepID=A0A2I0UJ18_LIMLA|nr:hypothetical protein llap_3650 [Limosa lapponica baueri]